MTDQLDMLAQKATFIQLERKKLRKCWHCKEYRSPKVFPPYEDGLSNFDYYCSLELGYITQEEFQTWTESKE